MEAVFRVFTQYFIQNSIVHKNKSRLNNDRNTGTKSYIFSILYIKKP